MPVLFIPFCMTALDHWTQKKERKEKKKCNKMEADNRYDMDNIPKNRIKKLCDTEHWNFYTLKFNSEHKHRPSAKSLLLPGKTQLL